MSRKHKPHWYFIYYDEYRICGKGEEERVRMYTPKPEEWAKRHEISYLSACGYHFQ